MGPSLQGIGLAAGRGRCLGNNLCFNQRGAWKSAGRWHRPSVVYMAARVASPLGAPQAVLLGPSLLLTCGDDGRESYTLKAAPCDWSGTRRCTPPPATTASPARSPMTF